ncbi:MAG: D-alanyl-D-alanine carboxypeptidase [Polaromonas sp.]|nr:D-alanyl-D-alanine carboxypeptidase [Polaromonas sp.]
MNPASVMKLVTTFLLWSTLGPDFTWQTSFYTNGKSINVRIASDLIIYGVGDPAGEGTH